MNVVDPGEPAHHRLANVGVEVDRIDDVDVRETCRDFAQGLADPLEAFAEALPPMTGDQYQAPLAEIERKRTCDLRTQAVVGPEPVHYLKQRVNYRVSGDYYSVGGDALEVKIPSGDVGGREIEFGERAGKLAVRLLGPRRIEVGCAAPPRRGRRGSDDNRPRA